MLSYPIRITQEEGGFTARCRDMSRFIVEGDTIDDLLQDTREMFMTAIECYMDDDQPVPLPSGTLEHGEILIHLDALLSVKTELYNAFKNERISKTELAKRLAIQEQNINHLFDLTRNTRLDTLEAAFRALNRKVVITVETADPVSHAA